MCDFVLVQRRRLSKNCSRKLLLNSICRVVLLWAILRSINQMSPGYWLFYLRWTLSIDTSWRVIRRLRGKLRRWSQSHSWSYRPTSWRTCPKSSPWRRSVRGRWTSCWSCRRRRRSMKSNGAPIKINSKNRYSRLFHNRRQVHLSSRPLLSFQHTFSRCL